MLTTNFYKIMLNKMQKDGLTFSFTKPDGTSGTAASAEYCLQGLQTVRSGVIGATAGFYGVCFGTGTTPPTKNDYTLEAPIDSGTLSSSVNTNPTQGFENDKVKIYITHEVKNSGSRAVTITEAGVFGCPTSSSKSSFLLDRTLLETPVTVPAGETRSITYTIVFDYPTA